MSAGEKPPEPENGSATGTPARETPAEPDAATRDVPSEQAADPPDAAADGPDSAGELTTEPAGNTLPAERDDGPMAEAKARRARAVAQLRAMRAQRSADREASPKEIEAEALPARDASAESDQPAQTPEKQGTTPPAATERAAARGKGRQQTKALPPSETRALPPPQQAAPDSTDGAGDNAPRKGRGGWFGRRRDRNPRPKEPAASQRTPRGGIRPGETRSLARMSRAARVAALSSTSQDAPLEATSEEADVLGRVLAIIVRLVATLWLFGVVTVWARLIGLSDSALVFDWHAPSGPWMGTAIAAVVMPVVAVGLWLLSSWGVVLWAIAIAAYAGVLFFLPQTGPVGVEALAGNLVLMAAASVIAVVRWRRADARG